MYNKGAIDKFFAGIDFVIRTFPGPNRTACLRINTLYIYVSFLCIA